ncbi:7-carboxy-7-deazaguanine synthase [Magnetospirillum fulvum]|uniref:7-carboxy-7-deazaguanine synthase n=1 Tax=Magnetospirillum fulvum TaxID=1082 RepID=A0A1H6J4U8_MAGFU|nr:7-carboxy-7-deazaguanine synthase [Magnetospirillum fulvum]SEH57106.1 7-carboxy-7-deazaguanine synthase, Cx14CxxC type [Magnetospirillum fulvum]
MSYLVREIFASLQGEGVQSGRVAVFLRFAECNLWSGREADRATARCRFCDTDFVGGERFADAETLADAVAAAWPVADSENRLAVVTGGEPGLQLDEALIAALHRRGFAIAVETNGTLPLPPGLDWICVSPKAGNRLVVVRGDELKLVFPQDGADPAEFESLAFAHFLLQPMDGAEREANTAAALDYCLSHPRWRLGLQLHKSLGLR